jgi:hypothetical protein
LSYTKINSGVSDTGSKKSRPTVSDVPSIFWANCSADTGVSSATLRFRLYLCQLITLRQEGSLVRPFVPAFSFSLALFCGGTVEVQKRGRLFGKPHKWIERPWVYAVVFQDLLIDCECVPWI